MQAAIWVLVELAGQGDHIVHLSNRELWSAFEFWMSALAQRSLDKIYLERPAEYRPYR